MGCSAVRLLLLLLLLRQWRKRSVLSFGRVGAADGRDGGLADLDKLFWCAALDGVL